MFFMFESWVASQKLVENGVVSDLMLNMLKRPPE
jgi:hypothetical protein